MYKLTRKNGSFPKYLQIYFPTYDKARQELRKYLRKVGWVPRSTHAPLWLSNVSITRV